MTQISVGESLRFGWATFKKRPLIFIGAFILALVISGVTSSLLDPEKGAPVTLTSTLMSIVSGVIGLFIELGLLSFALRAHDNVEKANIKDLWNPKPFWKYFVGQIIVGVIVVVGLILLIVPGVIAALGLMFTSYLIVDKGLGPIEALKASWHMTKGHKGQIGLLILAIIGINILGLLALIVGLLVSVPVSMLATVHVYRKISHGISDATPVPTA